MKCGGAYWPVGFLPVNDPTLNHLNVTGSILRVGAQTLTSPHRHGDNKSVRA